MATKYYDLKRQTFDCKKAYKYYVNKIGTNRPSKMTDIQIVIFSFLSFLTRHYIKLSLNELNRLKEFYLQERFKFTKEQANQIDLLCL